MHIWVMSYAGESKGVEWKHKAFADVAVAKDHAEGLSRGEISGWIEEADRRGPKRFEASVMGKPAPSKCVIERVRVRTPDAFLRRLTQQP